MYRARKKGMKTAWHGGHGTLVTELSRVAGCAHHSKIGRRKESASCCFGCHDFYCCDLVRGISEVGQMNVALSPYEA